MHSCRTTPLLSGHPHFRELSGPGCRYEASGVLQCPEIASSAVFARIRAKKTRRKAPRIAFLGCKHTPVPGESSGPIRLQASIPLSSPDSRMGRSLFVVAGLGSQNRFHVVEKRAIVFPHRLGGSGSCWRFGRRRRPIPKVPVNLAGPEAPSRINLCAVFGHDLPAAPIAERTAWSGVAVRSEKKSGCREVAQVLAASRRSEDDEGGSF